VEAVIQKMRPNPEYEAEKKAKEEKEMKKKVTFLGQSSIELKGTQFSPGEKKPWYYGGEEVISEEKKRFIHFCSNSIVFVDVVIDIHVFIGSFTHSHSYSYSL
jgi:hypothetical protein